MRVATFRRVHNTIPLLLRMGHRSFGLIDFDTSRNRCLSSSNIPTVDKKFHSWKYYSRLKLNRVRLILKLKSHDVITFTSKINAFSFILYLIYAHSIIHAGSYVIESLIYLFPLYIFLWSLPLFQNARPRSIATGYLRGCPLAVLTGQRRESIRSFEFQ